MVRLLYFSSSYEAFHYSKDTSQGFLQDKTDELKVVERQFLSFDGQSNCEQLHPNYRKHSKNFKFPTYDRIIIWLRWQSDRDYQNNSSYATDNFQLIGEFDEFILTDIKFV